MESILSEFLPLGGVDEPNGSCEDGLWWQWQQQGPLGWEDFPADVNAQLEEAYALGEATCSFWSSSSLCTCNLHDMRMQDSFVHIRRVRMPQVQLDNVPQVLPENVPETWDGLGAWARSMMDDGAMRWADFHDPLLFTDLDVAKPPEADILPEAKPEVIATTSPKIPPKGSSDVQVSLRTRSAWVEPFRCGTPQSGSRLGKATGTAGATERTLRIGHTKRDQKQKSGLAARPLRPLRRDGSAAALLASMRPRSVTR